MSLASPSSNFFFFSANLTQLYKKSTGFEVAFIALLLVRDVLLCDLLVGVEDTVAVGHVDVHDVGVEVVAAVHAHAEVEVAEALVGLGR